jgi:TRAP transporter TAXI family solute receptor
MAKTQKSNMLYFVLPILLCLIVICLVLFFLPAHDQITRIKQIEVEKPIPPQLYSSAHQLIGTGNRLGSYYPLGKIFADYFNQNLSSYDQRFSNQNFKIIETNGSVDNVSLVEDGSILLGMAENRIVNEVYIKNKETSNLRVVWPLWVDVVHVLKTPEVYEPSDTFPGKLRGFMGQSNSSTLRTTQEILNALERPRTNHLIGSNEVIPSLAAGKIGFAVIQAGMPNSTVADAILFNQCSLYSFSPEEISKILEKVTTSRSITIPEKTYGANQSAINTIAMPNVLVTRADASADLIEAMVALLVKNTSRLKLRYSTLETLPTSLSEAESIFNELDVPLHPGVERYLATLKIELGKEN